MGIIIFGIIFVASIVACFVSEKASLLFVSSLMAVFSLIALMFTLAGHEKNHKTEIFYPTEYDTVAMAEEYGADICKTENKSKKNVLEHRYCTSNSVFLGCKEYDSWTLYTYKSDEYSKFKIDD